MEEKSLLKNNNQITIGIYIRLYNKENGEYLQPICLNLYLTIINYNNIFI